MNEFSIAKRAGIRSMEWTLDQERLHENPLMTTEGRALIRSLCEDNELIIPSLTGDCFMQAPFWKSGGANRERLHKDFISVCVASSAIGIKLIVVPLVDNGSLENIEQEDLLVEFLLAEQKSFETLNVSIIFESDYSPEKLRRFIARLPAACFGINYDIGNSAAIGFNPKDEFFHYGDRVLNVHVKDRILGGVTVPLTKGNAQFETVFSELARIGYRGNFILQTARAIDGNHLGALINYFNMTLNWMRKFDLEEAA